MEIFGGLIIGIAGSLHCIGMCGPIVFALPGEPQMKWRFVSSRVIYNCGRVITYASAGALLGLAGSRISLFGFQRVLSLVAGALMLLLLVYSLFGGKFFSGNNFSRLFFSKFRKLFRSFYEKKTLPAMFGIGILNGFLPCGLVYFALTASLLTGSAFAGMLFMALFGIGTVPVMLGVAVFGNRFNLALRRRFTKLAPVFVLVLALLFILRGLNLGIPYISPQEAKQDGVHQELYCK